MDTSVYLAALLKPKGLADQIIKKAIGEYIICSSHAIIEEFKSKLKERGIDASQVEQISSVFTDPNTIVICDETDYPTEMVVEDLHIIGCYLKCHAQLVVTQDKGLNKRLHLLGIPSALLVDFKRQLGLR